MQIPEPIRAALVEHSRAEAPNEACGLVAFHDGVAERYLPGRNRMESPYRFELEPGSPDDWFLEDHNVISPRSRFVGRAAHGIKSTADHHRRRFCQSRIARFRRFRPFAP